MRLTNQELQTAIDNALCRKTCLAEIHNSDYHLDNHIESLLAEQRNRLYEQPEENLNAKSSDD